MLTSIGVLVATLALVTLGAEALVRGASALALRAGLSPLFIGLTIVGFGTSSPELAASVTATLRGQMSISVGNCVGSNIFNIAVIIGISAVLSPIAIALSGVRRDLVVMTLVALVPFAALPLGGAIGRPMGAAMLVLLGVYLLRAYRVARRAPGDEAAAAAAELDRAALPAPPHASSPRATVAIVQVVAGLALLIIGSRLFVTSAVDIARTLGVSELVIGLTIVAAGTSLPELLTSVVAALRKAPDIAVGNVIGSNIFNILGILGVSALIAPQPITPQTATLDTPVMLGVSLALAALIAWRGGVPRPGGVALLVAYALYLGALLAIAPASTDAHTPAPAPTPLPGPGSPPASG